LPTLRSNAKVLTSIKMLILDEQNTAPDQQFLWELLEDLEAAEKDSENEHTFRIDGELKVQVENLLESFSPKSVYNRVGMVIRGVLAVADTKLSSLLTKLGAAGVTSANSFINNKEGREALEQDIVATSQALLLDEDKEALQKLHIEINKHLGYGKFKNHTAPTKKPAKKSTAPPTTEKEPPRLPIDLGAIDDNTLKPVSLELERLSKFGIDAIATTKEEIFELFKNNGSGVYAVDVLYTFVTKAVTYIVVIDNMQKKTAIAESFYRSTGDSKEGGNYLGSLASKVLNSPKYGVVEQQTPSYMLEMPDEFKKEFAVTLGVTSGNRGEGLTVKQIADKNININEDGFVYMEKNNTGAGEMFTLWSHDTSASLSDDTLLADVSHSLRRVLSANGVPIKKSRLGIGTKAGIMRLTFKRDLAGIIKANNARMNAGRESLKFGVFESLFAAAVQYAVVTNYGDSTLFSKKLSEDFVNTKALRERYNPVEAKEYYDNLASVMKEIYADPTAAASMGVLAEMLNSSIEKSKVFMRKKNGVYVININELMLQDHTNKKLLDPLSMLMEKTSFNLFVTKTDSAKGATMARVGDNVIKDFEAVLVSEIVGFTDPKVSMSDRGMNTVISETSGLLYGTTSMPTRDFTDVEKAILGAYLYDGKNNILSKVDVIIDHVALQANVNVMKAMLAEGVIPLNSAGKFNSAIQKIEDRITALTIKNTPKKKSLEPKNNSIFISVTKSIIADNRAYKNTDRDSLPGDVLINYDGSAMRFFPTKAKMEALSLLTDEMFEKNDFSILDQGLKGLVNENPILDAINIRKFTERLTKACKN